MLDRDNKRAREREREKDDTEMREAEMRETREGCYGERKAAGTER